MAKVVLVLGGARSGKSRFAQQLAESLGGDEVLFVATARAGDPEMARRIERHQQARPASWQLLEVTGTVGPALAQSGPARVVLLDCLTLLVSNILLEGSQQPDEAQQRVEAELDRLLEECGQRRGTVIIVSGEVGCGLVPDSSLGRTFRDLLGGANQRAAREAAACYLLVAGNAIECKSQAVSLKQAARECRGDG